MNNDSLKQDPLDLRRREQPSVPSARTRGWLTWLLVLPLTVILVGCGGSGTPKRTDVDHSLFQDEFENAPAEARSALDEASRAAKKKNFVAAFQSMEEAVKAMEVNDAQYDALSEVAKQMQQVVYSILSEEEMEKADKAYTDFLSALDPRFKKAQEQGNP